MLLSYLQYYYYSFRYPHLSDYIDKGIGIEHRYRRCRHFWAGHLARSKEFQIECLGDEDAQAIAVLGSGRLYDIDLPALCSASSELFLFDADPSAVAYAQRRLRKAGRGDECRILDVTGVIEEWTEGLKGLMRNRPRDEDVALFISQLSPRTDIFEKGSFDTVISLNLLSQISLFWLDRATSLIPNAVPDISAALEISCMRLQEAHIEILKRSSRSRVIVISDVLFHTYNGESCTDAAIAVNPEESMDRDKWDTQRSDAWIWDILPKGVEDTGRGTMHEVRAWCFTQNEGKGGIK